MQQPPLELKVRLPDRAAVVAAARDYALRSIEFEQHRSMVVAALSRPVDHPALLHLHIDLAPLVFAAATGATETRIDLAALTFLLWTAFDVLDDIADGDAPARWPGFEPAALNVMGCSMISATAHAIVASLGASPVVQAQLHVRLAQGLTAMADGQIEDIANTGRDDVTAERVLASIAGKTGAECSLFTALGAILAGVPSEVLKHYERFGHEYGIANQLATDLVELFEPEQGRDIINGTRTLLMCYHLEPLEGSSREAFLEMLRDARSDRMVADGVRSALLASPALRRTALQTLIHAERARSALADAKATGPAAPYLARFLDEVNPIER